jgi:hypothetical protein
MNQSSIRLFFVTSVAMAAFAPGCGSDGDASDGSPDVIVIGDTGGDVVDNELDPGDTGEIDTEEPDVAPEVDAETDTRPDPELRPCEVNADCRGGEICRDDFCRESCTEDADCTTDGLGVCGEADYCIQCGEDSDCGEAEVCTDSFCEFFCRSSDDCGDRQACEVATGVCIDVECSSASDCGEDEVCVANLCVDNSDLVCTPSTSFCDDNTLVACSSDGRSEARVACSDAAPCSEGAGGTAACTPTDCEADTIGCLNLQTAFLCEADGTFIEAPCRSNQICVEGVCLVPECTPGSVVCDDQTVVTCNNEGAVVSSEACSERLECASSPGGCVCEDGDCTVLACVPDSGRCVGNAAQRCAADGRAYLPAEDCGENFCVSGTCQARVCEPSTQVCRDETVVTCNADGTAGDFVDCAATSQLCAASGDGAECVARACEPSSVECAVTGFSRLVCDARGAATTEIACPTGNYCDDGSCVAQVCTPGSAAVCSGNDVVQCDSLGSELVTVASCGSAGCTAGVCADPCAAATGNLGCEFYAVDLDNYRDECVSDAECAAPAVCTSGLCSDSAWLQQFAVSVANPNDAFVDIEVFNRAGTRLSTARIAARGTLQINLPSSSIDNSGVFEALRLTATLPVSMMQHNPVNGVGIRSNDTSMLLPTRALGTEHMVMAWPSSSTLRSSFTVVATGAGSTDMTLTLAAATSAATSGTPGAFAAGRVTNIRLFQGQALSVASVLTDGNDLSGTTITSTQPVAVFSSHECANVPSASTSFCDHVEEQVPPTTRWGTSYTLARSSPRGTEPDVFRVLARTDGTRITTDPVIAGVDGQTLNRGQTLQFLAAADTLLTATNDVLVGQFLVGTEYATGGGTCDRFFGTGTGCAIARSPACDNTRSLGDPGFAILAPSSVGRTRYGFRIAGDAVEHYVTYSAPASATITIDGAAPSAEPVTLGSVRIYRLPVTLGTHRIESTAPGTGIVYSYGCGYSTLTTLGY